MNNIQKNNNMSERYDRHVTSPTEQYSIFDINTMTGQEAHKSCPEDRTICWLARNLFYYGRLPSDG